MINKNQYLLLGLYFSAIIAVGIKIFPFWAVMLSCWFFALIFMLRFKFVSALSRSELVLFWGVANLYPLVATLIKVVILSDAAAGVYLLLNTLEHVLFSFCLPLFLYPLFRDWLASLPVLGQLVLVVGIVVFIGNLNEFLEFFIRVVFSLQSKFAEYYPDTIKDMAANIVGAALGYSLIKKVSKA